MKRKKPSEISVGKEETSLLINQDLLSIEGMISYLIHEGSKDYDFSKGLSQNPPRTYLYIGKNPMGLWVVEYEDMHSNRDTYVSRYLEMCLWNHTKALYNRTNKEK